LDLDLSDGGYPDYSMYRSITKLPEQFMQSMRSLSLLKEIEEKKFDTSVAKSL